MTSSTSVKVPSKLTKAILFNMKNTLETKNQTLSSRVKNLEQQVFFLTAFATVSVFWALAANQNLGVL
jgi:hypothetical protein